MSSFEAAMHPYPIAPGSEWMVIDVNGEVVLMGNEQIPTPSLIEVTRVNQMGEEFIVPYLLEEDLTNEFEDTATWTIYRFRPPFKWVRLRDDGPFLVGLSEERLNFWPEIVDAVMSGGAGDEKVKVPVYSRLKHVSRPVPIKVGEALETTLGERETLWLVWEPAWENEDRLARPTPRRKA
jgi:hypothetical protein